MARKKFLRAGYWKYSKLGLRRKNKQVYRKAKGGDNKVRLNEKGRLKKVKVGYRHDKKARGLVNGLQPVMIYHTDDLKKIQTHQIGIIAKMGHKKRLVIATEAQKKNIRLTNLNAKKFITRIQKRLAYKKLSRAELLKKKEEKEKAVLTKEAADKKAEEKNDEKQTHEHHDDHSHEHTHDHSHDQDDHAHTHSPTYDEKPVHIESMKDSKKEHKEEKK